MKTISIPNGTYLKNDYKINTINKIYKNIKEKLKYSLNIFQIMGFKYYYIKYNNYLFE